MNNAYICFTRSGDEQTIELLIQNGSDINLKDNNGTTILHSAVYLSKPI